MVGGGVVGLSIAYQLSSRRPDTTTLLIERHPALGTETSSRNSEVIHAGIYYAASSLKTQLCVRGRQLLYDFCAKHAVPHRNTGKWIVAQDEAQRHELEKLHAHCRQAIDVPVGWVSRQQVERDGEGVRAECGALDSPTTGIVDAHALMVTLRGLFEESGGGTVALGSCVEGIRQTGDGYWELDVRDALSSSSSTSSTSTSTATTTVSAETLINAAGLGSVHVHNLIVPPDQRRQLFFAKGNYFSYSASRPKITRLIYPAPVPGAGGLGTHLTLDMGGRVRFGPDVEWVDDPNNLAVNASRLELAIQEIKKYLPQLDETCLTPDYAGIRPKLAYGGAARGGDGQAGKGFNDFIVRLEDGYQGWVNCLGIESPGLTSSLAIGERIDQLLYGSTSP